MEINFLLKRVTRVTPVGGWVGGWLGGGHATLPETLNGRLPLEHGSVRPQTLGKRVSDDPGHFNFRYPKHQNFEICSKTLSDRLPL